VRAFTRFRTEHSYEDKRRRQMSMTTKASNAVQELTGQGQSLWLDNLRRDLVTSGELARLRDAGVTGITSNPTIFEKAIGGSSDYDAALAELVNAGRRPD
jgi:hypothetical protein